MRPSKKNNTKYPNYFHFCQLKLIYIDKNIFLEIENRVDSDRSEPDLSNEIIIICNFPFSRKL